MTIWRRLSEFAIGAYPDDTGMITRFFPTIKGGDFPYDKDPLTNEPIDGGDIHGTGHNVPTPHDTRHTAWDEDHDGDCETIGEAAGLPLSFIHSSPGQMAGVTPGGNKFGGDPFDHEVDDEKLSRYGEGMDNLWNMDDDDLKKFKTDMDSEQDPVDFPGSEPPSDIVIMTGEFSQGLGHALGGGRDIAGIRDSVNDITKKTVWSYLEQWIVREISRKK